MSEGKKWRKRDRKHLKRVEKRRRKSKLVRAEEPYPPK